MATVPKTTDPIEPGAQQARSAVLDITVLAGGPSAEREVSLQSGKSIHEALLRLGHNAILRDIGPTDLSALDIGADVVMVALHGAFGEDGTVQDLLEERGLPYCGSGVAASRLAMNKVAAKRRFESAGIPTPLFETVSHSNLSTFPSVVKVPAVVKPVDSGSSVDTMIARSDDELREGVKRVVEDHGEALVETYVQGPELTVGILGDQALPVCEIRTTREFYDYRAKYIDDDTEYLFDLDFPTALLERVQAMSLGAHRALGCEVFSRVDWMVDAKTMEPFALEVNTIPGFTSHSLLPKAASMIGLSFDELCARIVALTLEKSRGA